MSLADNPAPILLRVWCRQEPRCEAIEAREGRWSLGRDTLADDDRMSRRHCEVEYGAAGWVIRDLGSANGTHINGDGWVARGPGDPWKVLQIGRSLIVPLAVSGSPPLRLERHHGGFIGPSLHPTCEAVRAAASERRHVLLVGQPGCGFELLARHYHRSSRHPGFHTVHALARLEVPAASVPPGVALIEGGVPRTYASHPWIGEALRRRDLALILALEWDPRDGLPELPEPLRSRFCVINVPPLAARPEEIPWWVAHAVEQADPTVRVDLTFPEACLLRTWERGIPALRAETLRAVERARARDPAQPLLAARDLNPYAGLGTHRRVICCGGVAPPSGPRLPAPGLQSRESLAQRLAAAGGDPGLVATRLGITRETVLKWLRYHGLVARDE